MIFVDECTNQQPKVPAVSLLKMMRLLSVDKLVIYIECSVSYTHCVLEVYLTCYTEVFLDDCRLLVFMKPILLSFIH